MYGEIKKYFDINMYYFEYYLNYEIRDLIEF